MSISDERTRIEDLLDRTNGCLDYLDAEQEYLRTNEHAQSMSFRAYMEWRQRELAEKERFLGGGSEEEIHFFESYTSDKVVLAISALIRV